MVCPEVLLWLDLSRGQMSKASWNQFTLELWKCPSSKGGSSLPHPSLAGICHHPEQLLREWGWGASCPITESGFDAFNHRCWAPGKCLQGQSRAAQPDGD